MGSLLYWFWSENSCCCRGSNHGLQLIELAPLPPRPRSYGKIIKFYFHKLRSRWKVNQLNMKYRSLDVLTTFLITACFIAMFKIVWIWLVCNILWFVWVTEKLFPKPFRPLRTINCYHKMESYFIFRRSDWIIESGPSLFE